MIYFNIKVVEAIEQLQWILENYGDFEIQVTDTNEDYKIVDFGVFEETSAIGTILPSKCCILQIEKI